MSEYSFVNSMLASLSPLGLKLAQTSEGPLDGHDLIRLAAHLAGPLFAPPDLWHKTKHRTRNGYTNVTRIYPRKRGTYEHSDCRQCHRQTSWELESEKDHLDPGSISTANQILDVTCSKLRFPRLSPRPIRLTLISILHVQSSCPFSIPKYQEPPPCLHTSPLESIYHDCHPLVIQPGNHKWRS